MKYFCWYRFGHAHGRYAGIVNATTIDSALTKAQKKYSDIYADSRITEFYVDNQKMPGQYKSHGLKL